MVIPECQVDLYIFCFVHVLNWIKLYLIVYIHTQGLCLDFVMTITITHFVHQYAP